jgi:hypothetical protein
LWARLKRITVARGEEVAAGAANDFHERSVSGRSAAPGRAIRGEAEHVCFKGNNVNITCRAIEPRED